MLQGMAEKADEMPTVTDDTLYEEIKRLVGAS